jgi:hypothetical protein
MAYTPSPNKKSPHDQRTNDIIYEPNANVTLRTPTELANSWQANVGATNEQTESR